MKTIRKPLYKEPKPTAKERLKSIWKWLRKNAFNKKMFVCFLVAELIFWSPCIVTGILAVAIDPWWWSVFGSICLFWSGPFTPAVPLQIGLAILLRKIYDKIKGRKHNEKGND